MLDFCPFDFTKIDMENLAYELVPLNGLTWEKIKEETFFGESEVLDYIEENDTVRSEEFLERKKTDVQHVMVLEDRAGKKSGFQHILELLEKNGGDIRYEFENGQHIFKKRNKKIIRAMPCCPYCHSRLPIGWEDADDFAAISLMGRTQSGKTTMLYSWLVDNWEKLSAVFLEDGREIFITPAHREDDPTDAMYYALEQEAKAMCKDYGNCPHNTEKDISLPPVFLKVVFDSRTMIVGIYDNAGENLTSRAYDGNTAIMEKLLDKMFAEIFLFDPEDMKLVDSEEELEVSERACKIMDLEEQGSFQLEHKRERIHANELLSGGKENRKNEERFESLRAYNRIKRARNTMNLTNKMKSMYLVGVLSKCDLIENMPVVQNERIYGDLFMRGVKQYSPLDDNQIEGRSDIVRKLFTDLNLFGEDTLNWFHVFERDHEYGGVFWDCISALGCKAQQQGTLYGKYAPIRVLDPLLTCIIKRLEDNEWL